MGRFNLSYKISVSNLITIVLNNIIIFSKKKKTTTEQKHACFPFFYHDEKSFLNESYSSEAVFCDTRYIYMWDLIYTWWYNLIVFSRTVVKIKKKHSFFCFVFLHWLFRTEPIVFFFLSRYLILFFLLLFVHYCSQRIFLFFFLTTVPFRVVAYILFFNFFPSAEVDQILSILEKAPPPVTLRIAASSLSLSSPSFVGLCCSIMLAIIFL